MKKALLSGIMFLSTFAFSQQLISFETSEGYTSGNINGQQGWVTTSDGGTPPTYITGQVISSEQATSGTSSLKIAEEVAWGPQSNGPVMGAFKSLTTPLSPSNFTISFDVRMTEQSSSSSDFLYRGVSVAATSGLLYYITFRYNGTIGVANIIPPATSATVATVTGVTWAINTWYRVKIVGTATGVQYYLNDTLIYTANHLSTVVPTSSRIDFIHDNYGGDGYIDRIAINNEAALATKESNKENHNLISIYPNPVKDVLNIKSSTQINFIEIYDLSGKRVKASLEGDKVNVSHLTPGSYMITIETKEGKTTEKFIKK